MLRPNTRRYALPLLALLAGLLLSLWLLPVQSQENPNIIIPSGDSQALVEAIQRANQTPGTPINIYLQVGQYLLYAPNEAGRPSLPTITGKVTVFGQDTLILLQSEGATPAQIEVAPGASAEFHHVHFLLASGTGRAVVNWGTVRLYDSRFGSLDREVLSGVGEGGGIENYGRLSIERVTFARNQYLSTNTEGGAISNAGTLTASCTRFVEGLASRGGAVFNTGSATIFSSAFEENIANGGGAIFSAEGTVDASGNWWRGSEPTVNDLYLGRDTISAGVNADSPLASDPTRESGCQAQHPITSPEALGAAGTAPTLTNTTAADNPSGILPQDPDLGPIIRVSVASDGTQGNAPGYANPASISADGRYVAFGATYNNLVPGDTNNESDVFLHDCQTGETIRVSVSSTGAQANGSLGSSNPRISGDGRFIAFLSDAPNLVPNDTNGKFDYFVYDRTTLEVERVSVSSDNAQSNGGNLNNLFLSKNGRYVVFSASASDLVAGDTNGYGDVFVRDRVTSETTRISLSTGGDQGNGGSFGGVITEDGRFVLFNSEASNLVEGDTNGVSDAFIHDRLTGQTVRVSFAWDGSEPNLGTVGSWISPDGRYVILNSEANLVPEDTNNYFDVYFRDLQTGTVTRVSVDSEGNQADGSSIFDAASDDGRFIAFSSTADNLVINDAVREDTFIHDRVTGLTIVASTTIDGAPVNDRSYTHSITETGNYLAILSYASNLVIGDTNNSEDIFRVPVNFTPGSLTPVSPTGAITSPSPTFIWQREPKSTSFEVQVIRSDSTVVYTQTHTTSTVCDTTTCVITPPLDLGIDSYTWQVRGLNAAGSGAWSSLGFFVTDMTLTPSNTPTPSRTMTPSQTPTLTRTPSLTLTRSLTPSLTNTRTPTRSLTPSRTWTRTPSRTPSRTPTPTWTLTPSMVPSSTLTRTPTSTAMMPLPGTIVQVSPSGNITSRTPTFIWQKDANSTSYDIQVVRNGVTVIHNQNYSAGAVCTATTCSITPPLDLDSDYYSWWVRGGNGSGTGPWSGQGFAMTILPSAVAQISPSRAITSHTPTLTWYRNRDAHEYGIWIGHAGNTLHQTFLLASTYCNETTCSYTPPLDLSSDYYTWWIGAYSLGGGGNWVGMSFYVAVVPGLITQTAPIGAYNGRSPTFTWDRDRDSHEYGIWIGQGGTTLHLAYIQASTYCNETTCSYTPALNLSSDYYTWWVGGYSLGGGGPWNGNGFHVTVTPAAVFQLGPQGTINQSNPSFTWYRNRDAHEYGIWIGQGSTSVHQTTVQANTVCPSQTPGSICTYTPSLNLAAGGYSWWIGGYSLGGGGPWSSMNFTVQ